ncbi:CDP-alcohol phosphatidyltransferase family protein [Sneathiella glossodoripedis]|uniref:CDP-alcohol phosphatidyltransferase family protein n=1 Tax=Sneathiella glossodoripedis TaxID=418853 RepID=UPI00047275F2|nr:CDP-alcohol phosphatidyltransferase family protein [Sneathiella glossodoripedis]
MPSVYELKTKFQNLLRPVVDRLAKIGVTANQVTIFAIVISLLGGTFIALFPTKLWPLLLVPLILFVRMALNAIDGMLAREYSMESDLGAVLNELGDVISDIALYAPFYLLPGVPVWGVMSVVMLAIMIEMIGVVAVQIGASRRYDGPFGKSDRAFVFGLLAMFLGFEIPIQNFLPWIFGLLILLSLVTIFNRAKSALAEKNDVV